MRINFLYVKEDPRKRRREVDWAIGGIVSSCHQGVGERRRRERRIEKSFVVNVRRLGFSHDFIFDALHMYTVAKGSHAKLLRRML